MYISLFCYLFIKPKKKMKQNMSQFFENNIIEQNYSCIFSLF